MENIGKVPYNSSCLFGSKRARAERIKRRSTIVCIEPTLQKIKSVWTESQSRRRNSKCLCGSDKIDLEGAWTNTIPGLLCYGNNRTLQNWEYGFERHDIKEEVAK